MYGSGNISEPSHKVRIRELSEGNFEEIAVNQVRYFRLPWGSVSKVRIIGIVIDSWESNDGTFARLEIHDGTGSIQIKAWEEDISRITDPDTNKLYEVGSILDVIGRIRSWRDTIYLYPILINKVEDPNLILLRELEILRRTLRHISPPKRRSDIYTTNATIIRLLKDLGPLSLSEISDLLKLDLNDVSRKIAELRSSGLIYEKDDKYVYIGR